MKITIPTIAVMAAALILAPTGHADPTDDVNFFNDLNAIGINPAIPRSEPGRGVGPDQGICRDLGKGRDPNDIVNTMMRTLPNLTQNDDRFIVTTAVQDYCPNVLPRPLPWSPQS